MISRVLDPWRRCGRTAMVDLRSLIGVACVTCTLAAVTAGATAQIVERLLPFLAPASPAVTGSPPPSPPPPAGEGRLGAGAPDWSGQSGSSGHPRSGGELQHLPGRSLARCRTPRRVPRNLRYPHARPCARSAHHGPDGCSAGVHQSRLGL